MILSLNNWKFKAADQENWLPAQVPGDVHTDLLRNGLIEEPFEGTNEHRLQWIGKQNWEYEAVITLGKEWLEAASIELVFDGLDTYADVSVNGQQVLTADNMFRAWKADVKRFIHEGDNQVHILFRSPVEVDMPKLEALGYDLPAPNDQSELGGLGEKRVSVFARKAPYHYGWDWGPRFLNMGIWREARLEAHSGPVIRDLYIRQNAVSASLAELTAVLEVTAEDNWSGVLTLGTEDSSWEKSVALKAGINQIELDFTLDAPKLWWCNGLGEAHLYEFKAALLQVSGSEGAKAVPAAEKTVRTGLRDIRLVTEKDEYGASFRFELNGTPVFMKGANHIPNDSFITEMTEERYRHEIATAAASHMNMLRVWGGGFYEEEVFYRLCDEYGILVWQDFMFACSMYPGDTAFLDSVTAEAEYNIKRLRNHPCIALWCGNNEIDSAWSHYEEGKGWGWKEKIASSEIRNKMWADYEALFHDRLPKVVSEYHTDIAYWPSSPLRSLSGDENQHSNKIAGEGDVHYWGVWHNSEPFEYYDTQIGRFMSEYGFQSFPELNSVLKYAQEEDLELESEVMLAHQKNGHGNRLIKEYMDKYLPQPKDFKAFLYMSHVLQAEAIREAIEAHRRSKPYCMGTLYWQLNDCWPVASWASMDYYGRWKALQYSVKRSFQDVLLSVVESEAGLVNLYAVSDLRASKEAELLVTVYDFAGNVLGEWKEPVCLAADSSAVIFSKPSSELLHGREREHVLLRARLMESGQILAEHTYYFVKAAHIELEEAVISIQQTKTADGVHGITVHSDKLVRFVKLSAETEGIFSDNFFDLLPGEEKTVVFYRRGEAGEEAFVPAVPEGIEARSMADYMKDPVKPATM